MTKKVFLALAVCLIFFTIEIPVAKAKEPALGPLWGGGFNLPKKAGLEYYLRYLEDGQFVLYVVNPTSKEISVSVPKGNGLKLTVWKNDKMVWDSSENKPIWGPRETEKFAPGQGRSYKVDLPSLDSGFYRAEAYFLGEKDNRPVATNYFWVEAKDPLSYSVEFMGSGWFNQGPRLRVVIENGSGKDIKMAYQYGYQVLVKKAGDKDYLGNVGIGQSIGSIEKGAKRYVFVDVSKLKPGFYVADVRSNLGGGGYKVVSQVYFYIG